MPLQIKTQSIDAAAKPPSSSSIKNSKSRLKRIFERFGKEKDDGGGEIEPSSVCLDKLVVGFIEENNDKNSLKCGRRRCNCFNGNCDDSSDDEIAVPGGDYTANSVELLKGLVPCESIVERNLLADASRIVEDNKTKIGKGKDNCIKIVTENLKSLGYDAEICKSKWEKTASIPAGEYEYIDVIIDADRFILDVDFKSEFEIVRSTKFYRSLLQSLPLIFVGKPERIQQIVTLISEAAHQSLKKKGLHFPPWRKLEYMKAKWLAPHERVSATAADVKSVGDKSAPCAISAVNFDGEFEMRGGEEAEKITVVVSEWTPPAVRPKSVTAGARVVTGLTSVFDGEVLRKISV